MHHAAMPAKRTNPDFLNGVPELLVLRLVARGPMHGYELVQAIRAGSGEVLQFGEGSIYPILHRLETEGCLRSERTTIRGRERVVYQVTERGQGRLRESSDQWSRVAEAVSRLLQGGSHGILPDPAGS